MRISRSSAGGPGAAARAPRAAAGHGLFALPQQDSGAAPPEAVEAASGAAPVLTSLAPPAEAPAADHATQQAADVLDALRGLQLAALRGGGEGLGRSLAALQLLPRAAPPALDHVLRAIAQRAAVELAKSR